MVAEFVLNQMEGRILPIESKLRELASMTKTNVLVFYDVCRQNKADIPGLTEGDT